jgi:hypothetical protein
MLAWPCTVGCQARAFPRDNFAHAFIICGGHRICGRGLVPVCSRLYSDPGILFMYAYSHTHKPLRAYVQPRGMNHSMPFYAKWQTFGVRRCRNLEPCSNDIFGRMPHCIPVRHPHEHKFHHLVQNHRLETRRATFCKIYLTPVRRYKVCPLINYFFLLWFLIVYPPLHGPRPSNSDFPAPAVATVAAPVGTAKALATETKKEQALG